MKQLHTVNKATKLECPITGGPGLCAAKVCLQLKNDNITVTCLIFEFAVDEQYCPGPTIDLFYHLLVL